MIYKLDSGERIFQLCAPAVCMMPGALLQDDCILPVSARSPHTPICTPIYSTTSGRACFLQLSLGKCTGSHGLAVKQRLPGCGTLSAILASGEASPALAAAAAAFSAAFSARILALLAASRAFSASFLAASILANTGASAFSGKFFS